MAPTILIFSTLLANINVPAFFKHDSIQFGRKTITSVNRSQSFCDSMYIIKVCSARVEIDLMLL